MSIEIRSAPVDAIIPLRHRILRAGLPIESAYFEGDEEPGSVHFAAMEDDRVIGCVTLHRRAFDPAAPDAWQLRGMAVDEARQGAGVGSKLLHAVDAHVRSSGYSHLIWCRARKPAVAFYRRHGYEVVGDEYVVPTAGPHFTMCKRLAPPT